MKEIFVLVAEFVVSFHTYASDLSPAMVGFLLAIFIFFVPSISTIILGKRLTGLDNRVAKFFGMTKTLANAVSHEDSKVHVFNEFNGMDYLDLQGPNYARSSPLGLTKRGRKIARKLDARDTVERAIPTILKLVPNDATVLEIQNTCFDYAQNDLLDNVGHDEKQKIHRAIYENGGGIDNTLMVYGIMLRDAVFKSRDIKG